MTSRCVDHSPLDPKRKVACKLCCMQEFCVPSGFEPSELDLLGTLVERQRLRLRRGEHLFRTGEPFKTLYAIHTGSMKTYVAIEKGREHVNGFHISGDLLGLDAINRRCHTCSAAALEDTGVCVVPFERLEELARDKPFLQRQFHRIMGNEIGRTRDIMVLLAQMTAGARVAAFLIDLSRRFTARGFPGDEFRLPMSRNDVSNYLGLTPETISRMFSQFRRDKLITKRGKQVRILDLHLLYARLDSAPRYLTGGNPANHVQ